MAEARGACDSDVEAKGIGEAHGRTECIFPVLRHVGKAFFDNLRSIEVRIEDMEAANADTVHPFYILADSVFTDISVHPMPPYQGLCTLRRLVENFA